jgi:hypothetical protein
MRAEAETALIDRACSVSLRLVCETRSPSIKALGSSLRGIFLGRGESVDLRGNASRASNSISA